MNTKRIIQYQVTDLRQLPMKAHEDDVGWDLRARLTGEIFLRPQATTKIPTGLFLKLPHRYWAEVCARSGLATRGLVVTNGPGLIDTGYRGEICVVLSNTGKASIPIKPLDRIAQLVIMPDPWATWRALAWQDMTDEEQTACRGNKGFGSTGQA